MKTAGVTISTVKSPPSRSSLKSRQKMKTTYTYRKKKAPSPTTRSPTTELVIMTDRRREAYVPSKIMRAEPTLDAPPLPTADPVAEALQLIQADMTAQALSSADTETKATRKEPVVIRLNGTASRDAPLVETRLRRRSSSPPRESATSRKSANSSSPPRKCASTSSPPRESASTSSPPRESASASIFPDGIENFCLQARRDGHGCRITERFGELLQLQNAVQQLQRQLQLQVAAMRADAEREEAEADRERRKRIADGKKLPMPASPVPPTTAAETLLVLREQGGCCGPADLCLTPHDRSHAMALIHRLRCEVLELRACSLRTTMEKNEVAAKLNHERAQLRKTFSSAQLDRLTGRVTKGSWGKEDVQLAIAARRVLSRRQYRYVTEVLRLPLPSLQLRREALKAGGETKRLYEELVAEKVLMHMTKKHKVKRPVRPVKAAKTTARRDDLIGLAWDSSGSENEFQFDT